MKQMLLVAFLALLSGCTVVEKLSNYVDEDTTSDTQVYVEAGEKIVPTPEQDAMGIIQGTLIFPSEFLPPEMIVCAQHIQTAVEYCSDDHIENPDSISGVGFELVVPEGEYHVYAFLPSDPDRKAYYNEFVTCGLSVECTSREKIVVNVDAGETVTEVNPHDWYDTTPPETQEQAYDPDTCWGRVITQDGDYLWPDGCGGMKSRAGTFCTQVLTSLTPSQETEYQAWLDAGSPQISGCGN